MPKTDAEETVRFVILDAFSMTMDANKLVEQICYNLFENPHFNWATIKYIEEIYAAKRESASPVRNDGGRIPQ